MLWSRVNLGRKKTDCWHWRIGKVRCIRNISQKTECERSPDNPKRWTICISSGIWFSKIIRKKLRIPRTHSETGIHRKERISAENLMAIGKSFNLKKQMVTQKLGKIFGLSRRFHVSSSYCTDKFNCTCREKNHILLHWVILMSSAQLMQIWRLHKEANLWLLGCRLEQKSVRFVDGFPRDLRYWAKFLKKEITNRRGDWRKFKRHHVQIIYGLMEGQEMGKLSGNCYSMQKTVFPNMHTGNCSSKTTRAKVSEVKENSVVLILQVHDGILYYITTLVHEFFPMKRSDESSSPNFF